ncbi:MAG: TIGR04283 family arsenosugar biosynthesis glycosyltransferase [Candidatus Thiodiazotropha sp. (ex Monitilora ramsayi)]|nr:TIGR04283 family arsenosugar biosynthesis glycosyltransferase [Candidatus Thiodiazotropha sp. (ex Monitilora ramsayi)]
MRLSIIVPVLNENGLVLECVKRLARLNDAGHELILVDGGSEDLPEEALRPHVDQLLVSKPGRAIQMNLGADAASGDVFWFLHVDSQVDTEMVKAMEDAIENGATWGRFDIRLSGAHPLLRVVERMMNWRSRKSGIATGDQGIFTRRSLFKQVGGYPEQALMEDVEISRRLKRHGMPACLSERLVTSSRRWERRGILRTIVLMWGLRLAYWLGVSPSRLASLYRPCPTTSS